MTVLDLVGWIPSVWFLVKNELGHSVVSIDPSLTTQNGHSPRSAIPELDLSHFSSVQLSSIGEKKTKYLLSIVLDRLQLKFHGRNLSTKCR